MDTGSYTLRMPVATRGVSWRLPDDTDPRATLPCVVLADRTGMGEFTGLQRGLRTLGVPSVRIDAGSVAALTRHEDGSLTIDGRRILPTVTWVRHFAFQTGQGAHALFRAESWVALVDQVTALSSVRIPDGLDPGRLAQLDGAAKAGIRVPRTIVTTDPGSASFPSRKVVVKALNRHFVEAEPGLLEGVFPEIGDRTAFHSRDVPMIVQEYVEHTAELRVYHVNGEIRAFQVDKPSPAAIWRDEDSVTVTPVAVPSDVAEAVTRLADLWGLRYGAFDFLLTTDGPVFLEVNPDGDWRWFESKAGVDDISMATLAMVRSLHRETTRIDLTGFLLLGGPGRPPALDTRVLGPLDLRIGGAPVHIGARKSRLLAAILLSNPNEVVPTDHLIDSLWSGRPPATARKNLQVYVSELRKRLGDRISYEGWGYRLDAQRDELDLLRFRDLAAAGREMRRRGAGDAALTLLDRALNLWRGRPLAEFAGVPLVDDAVGRMTELYLTLNEDWAELQIERGRFVDVLNRLDGLAAFFPARERLIAARMTALAGCGRAPEALAQFEAVRIRLSADLGIDPSPVLKQLYTSILMGKPATRPRNTSG
ncbi:BTAD domain-containing putative transcriptional regulator [Herbidospora mongoliensis]|uniref:BTAD domain-containing putative transcriptional regulator n=1 Tax=Herbidospora mongoliensis TaxID=688067 RepID=UPI000834333B|nr:BTAD domain-containing putative transcriptional regulator [Herbidospora mongoliensis]